MAVVVLTSTGSRDSARATSAAPGYPVASRGILTDRQPPSVRFRTQALSCFPVLTGKAGGIPAIP